MANIRENKKNGKTVSYRFIVYLGKDIYGKQIRKYCTWTPPDSLSATKAKKAAERAADIWEREVKLEYQKIREAAAFDSSYMLSSEKRRDDFVSFVNNTWFTLYICNGDRKNTTVAYYADIAKYITDYFHGTILQDISSIHIQRYLQHIRVKHEKRTGRPLSAKYLRHHYGTLRNIFGYAEKNGLIVKNPINQVDAPKILKKPVDALSSEQADLFLQKIADCPLDFHTLLHLLITTGLRRGEALGLQWRDIDEKRCILNVERNVAYTPRTGIIVGTPKTASSIRTIPLLKELYSLEKNKHPDTLLQNAFIFHSENNIFSPRAPDAVTHRIIRFMKRCNLPTFSTHDLRHSCASLLLAQGADVKSVQQILGHSDASTTLNFYVKADIKQMQLATEKLAAAYNL